MKKFRDHAGRSWSIRFDAATIDRLKNGMGLSLSPGESDWISTIMEGPDRAKRSLQLLYFTASPDPAALGIGFDAFADAMVRNPKRYEAAMSCFMSAAADVLLPSK